MKTRLVEHKATPVDLVSCYENHDPVNLNGVLDHDPVNVNLAKPLYRGHFCHLENPKLQ